MNLNEFFKIYSKFKEYEETHQYTGGFDEWIVTIEAPNWKGLSLD